MRICLYFRQFSLNFTEVFNLRIELIFASGTTDTVPSSSCIIQGQHKLSPWWPSAVLIHWYPVILPSHYKSFEGPHIQVNGSGSVFKIRFETCWTAAQFWQNLYMTKKESLPDRRKFCRSGSAVRHLFWRLAVWLIGPWEIWMKF